MNDPTSLREELRHWLRLRPSAPGVEVEVVAVEIESSFERRRVTYKVPDGDSIPAFLLVIATSSWSIVRGILQGKRVRPTIESASPRTCRLSATVSLV
jgi:hypothetical protein